MAHSVYKENSGHYMVTESYLMKIKLDRERRQESDQDTREALRTSGAEFLRERQ